MSISYRKFVAALLAACILTGCTVTSTVKLYEGPVKSPAQLAMLYVDPHVYVSTMDGITTKPGERFLVSSAGKRREIAELAPGHHELKAGFFVLCLSSDGQLPIEFTVEAGKKYRLKSVVDVDQKRWRPTIVEFSGEEIEDTFPWMKAMCPVNVTIIRLGR